MYHYPLAYGIQMGLPRSFIYLVQPLPLQPGANFGSVPVGAVQHGSGLAGSSAAGTAFLPRNIDIRIRTGAMSSLVCGMFILVGFGKA